MRVARFTGFDAFGGGTEEALDSSVSGSGSGWHGFFVPAVRAAVFVFSDLALPPFDDRSRCRSTASLCFVSSTERRPCVIASSVTVKKPIRTGRIRSHWPLVHRACRAKDLSSEGRLPPFLHIDMSKSM